MKIILSCQFTFSTVLIAVVTTKVENKNNVLALVGRTNVSCALR